MKVWTYLEMYNKISNDLDLKDETWSSPDEIAGYFNEGLTEAEAEISELNKDYLLAKYYVPVVSGTGTYSLPDNIFANKIRGIMYANGSVIYPIVQYRRMNQFQNVLFSDQYGQNDDYRFFMKNDYPGQAQFELHPASRETAILPPQASSFYPVIMWYIRNCARVPYIGEYCNTEVLAPSQVNTGTNVITHKSGTMTYGIKSLGQVGSIPGSIAYITGDQVQVQAAPGGTVPGGLTAGTTYYVINVSATTIKLATTLANASAGTAITLTTQGTVFFTIQVAATTAIRNAVLIDIPEFSTFLIQWAKCRIMEKERNPGLQNAVDILAEQKKMMVDTLTNAIQDDDDQITPDFSHYEEMS